MDKFGLEGYVHLYRYPHPTVSNSWLYVGQGASRDTRHRSGKTPFGKRYLKEFSGVMLPLPVRWTEPAVNQSEANLAETVAMFKFHTWHGYSGGMNFVLPGSQDYRKMGNLQPREVRVKSGKRLGLENVKTGHLRMISRLGGLAVPPEVRSRLGKATNLKLTREQRSRGGRNVSREDRVAMYCKRWNINRGKPCTCGKHTGIVLSIDGKD